MLVVSITCHVPSRAARQRPAFTLNNSEPPWTLSSPVGFLLSVIGLQPAPVGGAQAAISAPDPACPPVPGPHHHAVAPDATSATATAPATSQRRLRLVRTAGSPRSDRTRPSTSWCHVSSCSTT